jgi:hypothetical protein
VFGTREGDNMNTSLYYLGDSYPALNTQYKWVCGKDY